MKKIVLISLIMVLALGGLGVGYAAWTDEVTVEGTVTTGEVCLEFVLCDLLDEAPWGSVVGGTPPYGRPVNVGGDFPTTNPDYNSLPGFVPNPDQGGAVFWQVDKNVGWGEQLITDDPGNPGDNDLLLIELYNTYPMYFNRLTFYAHNCGTIPLRINRVWINGISVTPGATISYDMNGDGGADWQIYWGNAIGSQIEPSDRLETSMWMQVLQPCPQDLLDVSMFNIVLEAVQWNEYGYHNP
jgi:predicted ribosomally synthesized peptide with SipW-like signal peptide